MGGIKSIYRGVSGEWTGLTATQNAYDIIPLMKRHDTRGVLL